MEGGGGGGGGDGGHRRRLPLSLLPSVPRACCLESQRMHQGRDQDDRTHLCDLHTSCSASLHNVVVLSL